MRRLLGPLLVLLGCGGGDSPLDAPTTDVMKGGDWRDEVIYQIVVDRFADGDVNNNHRVLYSALGRYQGGDWQGIINHLDYLKALGVTALWISPVVRNVDFDAGFDGYHGYWTQSLEKVNPHFGSPAKLRELVDRAHAEGFKVILDIVTNHVGQLFYYDINDNGQPDEIVQGSTSIDAADPLARLSRHDEYDPDFTPEGIQGMNGLGPSGPAKIKFLDMPEINRVVPDPVRFGPGEADVLDFRRPGVYNRTGRVTNYDVYEQLTTGDFPGGLKDLDTRRVDVRKGMIKAIAQLIRRYDFDGLRIDTLKHVEHEFWQEFSPAIRRYVRGEEAIWGVAPLSVPKSNFFIFGEAFDGDDALLGEYTYHDEVDSVFYFSQKFQVYGDVVKCGQPTRRVEQLWNDRLRWDPQRARLHEAYRTCNAGRCFRMVNGARVPDPAEGRPLYNQQGVNRGPVDSQGRPVPPAKLLVGFLDNHDVARYLSPLAGCYKGPEEARRQLHNALALLFTQDGIPCIYYGTEQEFAGGNDPANRERLFETILRNAYLGQSAAQRERLGDSGYQTTGETFRWIAHLARVRRAYPQLRRGELRVVWSSEHTAQESDAGVLAFERTYEGRTALVVTNVHESKASETAFAGSLMRTSFPAGTRLVDVLGDPYQAAAGSPLVVQAGGQLLVRVSSRATRVLVPEGDVVPVR
ncbi:MAG: alpha-amylase family glycosyl hydrolase [Myxococcales bacterium]|nr:alpha-amylase family glycosyl hydrolase [Myxococcota bacterium]MDW8283928.1 alpha-amylase family glycosyl hydrolase [Myxococcales bacterium]